MQETNTLIPRLIVRTNGAKGKLLDTLREALHARHYSHRTEQSYCHWVKCHVHFHNVRHPAEMAEPEMNSSCCKGERKRLDSESGSFGALVP